jgi:hypothetical protein
MEEKLKELLDMYELRLFEAQKERDEIRAKIKFCKNHNFEEEVRIQRVKLDALQMVLYSMEEFHRDVKELYNAWMS